MTALPSFLEVKHVRKAYGAIKAVDGVTFSVGPGEIVGVIGPNGSGKTTLFNSILGQIKPSAGGVEFCGEDITGMGVASADRAVRAVLNVSQSRSTAMARAISSHGGSSVHHIAFATDDIFDTMAKLRRNGAQFVPISPNYYDDLQARFDLPGEQVAKMREGRVLFERTPTGEYFHESIQMRVRYFPVPESPASLQRR